nr:PREDICTED: LOW QUALITY PROTEIN: aminopeptidase N-like [Linepithema humile]
MQNRNKRWLLATNFQPNGAQQVFPCFDEPAFRATFSISINCNQKYQVVSNMALNFEKFSTSGSTNNLQRAIINTTPKIYPNLVGFMIYDFLYDYTLVQEQTHRIYFRDIKLHVNFTKKVIENITSLFKDDWRKLEEIVEVIAVKYVLIPIFPFDGKNNWGLVYFREANVIYNQQLDSFGRKIEVARLIAQKMAHQVFGNLVSPSWWTDQWLNDGIAVFFGIDAVNKTFPNTRMWDLFVVRDLHESLHLDTYFSMKPLSSADFSSSFEIETTYCFFRYLKAPALLRMLHHIMTDKLFRNGIHLYLKTYQYRTATVDDFWTSMQAALDAWNEENCLLKMAMNTWTNDNYPIVNVATNFKENSDINVIVSQKNSNKFFKDKWWIPITWFTSKSLIHSDHSASGETWLHPDDTKVLTTINSANDWVIVNANRTGYYRVNYDNQNWQRIGNFLNSSHYKQIHVLTRAQLIDDAFHLMVAQKLKSRVFWKFTNYLSQETDYIAWYPMIKALEYMSSIFPFSNKKVENIKAHMVKILSALLNKIGYNEKSNRDNLTRCLREEATKWACILGDPLCKKYALQKLQWHLEDHKKNKLLPWWKEWTHCKGLMTADSMIWYSVVNVWDTDHDNTLLKHLLCSEDYYIVFQSITLMLDNNDKNIINVRSNDSVHYFLSLLSKHANNEHLLEDILDQFLDMKPNKVTETAALNIIINHIYSKKQLQKVKKFVNNKLSDLKLKVHYKIETRITEINSRIKYLHFVSK